MLQYVVFFRMKTWKHVTWSAADFQERVVLVSLMDCPAKSFAQIWEKNMSTTDLEKAMKLACAPEFYKSHQT